MDALQFLANDRLEATSLFEKIEGTYAKPADLRQASRSRAELFEQLKHALELHCRAEEKVIYPILKNAPATRDMIAGLYREQAELRRLLHALSLTDPQSEEFVVLLDELKRNTLRYLNEESDLFPKVQEVLSRSELEDLISQLQRERETEVSEDVSATTGAASYKPGILNSSRETGPIPRSYPARERKRGRASVSKSAKPQEIEHHPDIWADDLNPNRMAGQNIGQSEVNPGGTLTAYDVKYVHRKLHDWKDDMLKQIPLVPAGERLQQGGTYISLHQSRPQEFTATGDIIAGPKDYYVHKSRVPYELWNRLIGEEKPGQAS
jgi:iron-sulfur cluster repair protein YtfE (RIC family)